MVQNIACIIGQTNTTEWFVEALHCNGLVSFSTVSITTDPDTGKRSETVTQVYTDVPCSIITAEMFWSEPNNEPKDEFILRYPSTLNLERGADVTIRPFHETDGLFQHGVYTINYFEPDTIGVTTARIAVSPNA